MNTSLFEVAKRKINEARLKRVGDALAGLNLASFSSEVGTSEHQGHGRVTQTTSGRVLDLWASTKDGLLHTRVSAEQGEFCGDVPEVTATRWTHTDDQGVVEAKYPPEAGAARAETLTIRDLLGAISTAQDMMAPSRLFETSAPTDILIGR